MRRSFRFISLLAPIAVSLTVMFAFAEPAFADTGGYPWSGATFSGVLYEWGYTPSCPSSDTGCNSMTYTTGGVTYGVADPWLYNLRNCTSYVAWKINQVFGKNISGWGDASSWDSSAISAGYSNDSSPQVGDIAQWTSGDHVAYVYKVVSGVAYFDEYNADVGGQWGNFSNSRTSSTSTPDHYIHIGTPPSSSIPSPVGIDDSGTMNVFTVGGDNNVYQDFWNSGTSAWNGFTSIGTGMTGTPAVLMNGSALNIFTIGTDGTVYTE